MALDPTQPSDGADAGRWFALDLVAGERLSVVLDGQLVLGHPHGDLHPGEAEQIVASHPGSEDAFQVCEESAHDCVGYPARWVRTIQVRESGLRRMPLTRTRVN